MQSYTLTNLLVTVRNDQAKDGQESTFYMTTPPLISVRLLSLFLASEKVEVLNHPPYSSDRSPCDFFLFPRLKKLLSGNKYTLVRLEVLLAALLISVTNRYQKKTIYLLFATG